MTVAFCPQCGTSISGEFKFCPSCGAKLPSGADESNSASKEEKPKDQARADQVLRCPTCGFLNPGGTKACESCGSFLGGVRGERVKTEEFSSEPEESSAEREPTKKQSTAKKPKKKGHAQHRNPGPSTVKRFHLETYQITAIAAAVLLGAVLIYGLMSSGSSTSAPGTAGAGSQQTTSSGQPSTNVLHEINRLREVVDKEPDDLPDMLRLANMLEDNSFYDQAAIYYKRYLSKMPKNVDARIDYGVTLFEGGNASGAIEQIKEALKIDPNHQKGLFNLGVIYLNAGDIEKANAAFRRCVKVNPNTDIGKKAKEAIEAHTNITSQEVK